MHALEKSDCAVVPVNQPNKGGQPSAEAGEGRAQTKENIVQSRMHPTQSGKRMSQGLDRVRKAAKERKQERFTALLHHLNGIAGNLRALQRVHRAVERYWRKMLSSRSWDGAIRWEQFQRIKEQFPLLRPKLYLPYRELQAIAIL